MDVDVNPLNCLERHVDYCDLPQTILESSVCNLGEYSAKKSNILDIVFPDILALMNEQWCQSSSGYLC